MKFILGYKKALKRHVLNFITPIKEVLECDTHFTNNTACDKHEVVLIKLYQLVMSIITTVIITRYRHEYFSSMSNLAKRLNWIP